jgi:hypothetical protein
VTELVKPDSLLYSERVLPNFGTFAAVFVLLPSTVIIAEPFDLIIGLVVGLIAVSTIWGLLVFRAPRIQVSKNHLRVGRVSIARNLVGTPQAIDKSEIFAERGPNLDPAAHKVFQGSVKTAVKIPVTDPEDPTPYWLVSTRNPKKLVEALSKS